MNNTPDFDSLRPLAERIVDIASNLIPKRPFRPYQREMALSVSLSVLACNADELTALFSRQSGKTEIPGRLVPALMVVLPYLAEEDERFAIYTHGFWCGIFAPVEDQASTSFERVREVLDSEAFMELLEEEGLHFVEGNAKSRKLSNGSFIRIWSASPTANIESKTLHLAINEEAQDITPYKLRKSIEPMVTATRGTMWNIGTANEKLSAFYEAIQRNKRIERDTGRKLHFEYDYTEVIKCHPNYRFVIEKKIQERGTQWTESDEFQMAFKLKFILKRGQFCSFDRFNELEKLCQHIPMGPFNDLGQCGITAPTYFGIDWGKSSDSTVVTALARFPTHNQVLAWLEMVGDDYESQYPCIVEFIKKFPGAVLVVAESNAMGAPMVDRLKAESRKGGIRALVEGFNTTEASKSEIFLRLMDDFVNSNRVLIPSDPAARKTPQYQAFHQQFTDLEKGWKGSLLKVSHPDIKGSHDDYCVSLALANWGATSITTLEKYRQLYGKSA